MSDLKVFWKRYARHVVLPLGGLAITAAMLLPIYFTVVASLAPSSAVQALPQSLWPSHFVLSNYSSAIKFESGSVVTSLIISLGAVVLSIGIALPAAYGLTKLGYLKSRAITSVAIIVLLVTQMVPGISLTLSFYNLFRHFHLINNIVGLIVADSTYGVPFAVLVLRVHGVNTRRTFGSRLRGRRRGVAHVPLSDSAHMPTWRCHCRPVCFPFRLG